MTYLLLFLTILSNAVMDAVTFNNAFSRFGLWFSSDGWKCKYILTEWLNQYLPLWLSKFLAQDVLVVVTDLYHLSKLVMILSFMFIIFGFTIKALIAYMVWGLCFSVVYYLIR